MEPKQKAEQLIEAFKPHADNCDPATGFDLNIQNYSAVECAKICVDEIITSDSEEHPSDIKFEFWKQVKQELESYAIIEEK